MASSISTGSDETIDKLVQLENGLLTYQEGYLIPVTKIKIRYKFRWVHTNGAVGGRDATVSWQLRHANSLSLFISSHDFGSRDHGQLSVLLPPIKTP